jgi:hypothetical protein
MNYERIYNQIIERAKNEAEQRIQHKKQGGYYEGHHIIPRCMGGEGRAASWCNGISDTRHFNIVGLTAREHFLCHWLLVRMYPDNRRISFALYSMCNSKQNKRHYHYTVSSRLFQETREHHWSLGLSDSTKEKIRISKTGKMFTDTHKQNLSISARKKPITSVDTRQKISVALKGKKKPDDFGEKISKAKKSKVSPKKGIKLSEEHKLKIGQANKGKVSHKKGTKLSEETKEKIRSYNLGKTIPEETRLKIRETLLKRYKNKNK